MINFVRLILDFLFPQSWEITSAFFLSSDFHIICYHFNVPTVPNFSTFASCCATEDCCRFIWVLLATFAGFPNTSSCALTAYKFNAFIRYGDLFISCGQLYPSKRSHPYWWRLGSLGAGATTCFHFKAVQWLLKVCTGTVHLM